MSGPSAELSATTIRTPKTSKITIIGMSHQILFFMKNRRSSLDVLALVFTPSRTAMVSPAFFLPMNKEVSHFTHRFYKFSMNLTVFENFIVYGGAGATKTSPIQGSPKVNHHRGTACRAATGEKLSEERRRATF
jgi:hypothetical protein